MECRYGLYGRARFVIPRRKPKDLNLWIYAT